MRRFFDSYGILHHADTGRSGDPETSENGPLFTGVYYTEKGNINHSQKTAIRKVLICLYDGVMWRTTPDSKSERFSHDNFKGIISLILILEKNNAPSTAIFRRWVPLFHKQLIRPDNFFLVGYFKYPLIFWPTLPYVWFTMLLTCFQTYKVRNGKHILKTDGKIMTRMICKAFGWKYIYKLCTFVLKRERKLKSGETIKMSWNMVYQTYFQNDGHPLRSIEE